MTASGWLQLPLHYSSVLICEQVIDLCAQVLGWMRQSRRSTRQCLGCRPLCWPAPMMCRSGCPHCCWPLCAPPPSPPPSRPQSGVDIPLLKIVVWFRRPLDSITLCAPMWRTPAENHVGMHMRDEGELQSALCVVGGQMSGCLATCGFGYTSGEGRPSQELRYGWMAGVMSDLPLPVVVQEGAGGVQANA